MNDRMMRFAQTMETKWRLKAPEAFYSDVMEWALADDELTEDEKEDNATAARRPEDRERGRQVSTAK